MTHGQESDNIRLLRRLYEAWDRPAHEEVLAVLDPEFEFVNPDYAVDPGIRHGHDGFRQALANLDASFAEQHHQLEDFVDLGERILVHAVFHARGRDSGASVSVVEQHLWTVRDGKLVRMQWFHDAAEAEEAARAAQGPG